MTIAKRLRKWYNTKIMEQSKKSNNCATCPREASHQYLRGVLEQLRERFTEGSQAILDDNEARQFAAALHSVGALDDPTDTQAVRTLAMGGFELFDYLEKILDEERNAETQFCVGALKMRARDERTQYDVTLCRSPKSPASGNLEQAIVTRKTIR